MQNKGAWEEDGALEGETLMLTEGPEPPTVEPAKWQKTGRTTAMVVEGEIGSLSTATTGVKGEDISLHTAFTASQKQSSSLNTVIEGLEEAKKVLDGNVRELKGENEKLRSKVEELEQALREVQEQEYAASKPRDTKSHEAVRSQFENLFRECKDWAWEYFRLGVGAFQIEGFPHFTDELDLVSWGDIGWKDKKCFKVNHLVQAVLGNILVRLVFRCPFAGCNWKFRREFRDLYEVKLKCTIGPTAGYG